MLRSPVRSPLRSSLHSPLVSRFGGDYLPETESLFARMTTPPTLARKILINQTMVRLRATVAFSKLDYLRIWAAADSQAGSLNWIDATKTATVIPTFTADRGVNGDGVSTFTNEGWSAATGTNKFLRENNYWAIWSLTAAQGAATDAGVTSSTSITLLCRNSSDLASGRASQASSTVSAVPSTDGRGCFAFARDGANTGYLARNDVKTDDIVTASVALVANNFTLGRSNTTYSSRLFGASWGGAYVTPAQHAAIYNALLPYMQAVGAV